MRRLVFCLLRLYQVIESKNIILNTVLIVNIFRHCLKAENDLIQLRH